MKNVPKSKEQAIALLEQCLLDLSEDIIRSKVININPELFDDLSNEFKTLLTFIFEASEVTAIKAAISNFLKKAQKEEGTVIVASEIFRDKYKKLRGKTKDEIKNIILRITIQRINYPTETIKGYFISPRGHTQNRIIWRLQKEKIIFEDLFTSHAEYDRFCDMLRANKLPKDRYKNYQRIVI